MEAEIKEKFDAQVSLVGSSGGVFEVMVDGVLIYSKKKLDRHPMDGEIISILGKI